MQDAGIGQGSNLWPLAMRRALPIQYIYNEDMTELEMQIIVQEWGNSLALQIPKALAEEAGLEQGKPVDIRFENGELRIRKRRIKRYDLDELLASAPKDFDEGEWDTGPAIGNEVWW